MFLNEKSPWYPPHISGIEVIERDSFHWGDCSVMVWGSNFKHSSVRLEETIYIKYLYYKKSIHWNINTWRQVQVWYHGEHQLENAYSPFRPFYITSIYGLGKAANPPDISVVGVCEFYKISNSPTSFLRTQNNVANFPLPRGREANSSPCIPRHIPLVGPGSYPRGKPMTCALRLSFICICFLFGRVH